MLCLSRGPGVQARPCLERQEALLVLGSAASGTAGPGARSQRKTAWVLIFIYSTGTRRKRLLHFLVFGGIRNSATLRRQGSLLSSAAGGRRPQDFPGGWRAGVRARQEGAGGGPGPLSTGFLPAWWLAAKDKRSCRCEAFSQVTECRLCQAVLAQAVTRTSLPRFRGRGWGLSTAHTVDNPPQSTGLCSVLGPEQIPNRGVGMVMPKSLSQVLPKSQHWDFPEAPAPCDAKFLLEFKGDDLFYTQNQSKHLSF